MKLLVWLAGFFRCPGGCATDCRKHGTNSTGLGCPGVDYRMKREVADLRERVEAMEKA